jgi:hypothetical protein
MGEGTEFSAIRTCGTNPFLHGINSSLKSNNIFLLSLIGYNYFTINLKEKNVQTNIKITTACNGSYTAIFTSSN